MTHAAMDAGARARAGIADALMRLSVGIEEAEDLTRDLAQALEAAHASRRLSSRLRASGAQIDPRDLGRRQPRRAAALVARPGAEQPVPDDPARHAGGQPRRRLPRRARDRLLRDLHGHGARMAAAGDHRLLRRPDHLLDVLGRDRRAAAAGPRGVGVRRRGGAPRRGACSRRSRASRRCSGCVTRTEGVTHGRIIPALLRARERPAARPARLGVAAGAGQRPRASAAARRSAPWPDSAATACCTRSASSSSRAASRWRSSSSSPTTRPASCSSSCRGKACDSSTRARRRTSA